MTTERREPTISGIRPEKDEIARHQQPRNTGPGPNTGAAQRAVQGARPVVVKSTLAPVAMLFAIIGIGLAAFAYWQLMESQKNIVSAEQRITELENRLALSDDEATASLTVLQTKVKENETEIRKLWDTRNTNRKGISDNKDAIAAMAKTVNAVDGKISAAVKGATSEIKSEVKLVNELVEAQQGALVGIEKKNVDLQKQIQSLTDQLKQLEAAEQELNGRVRTNEQAIEAIDTFRRTVNQELLRLRGGA